MLSNKRSSSLVDLWARVGREAKRTTGFNSQVICDLARIAAKTEGSLVARATVKFNVPRNCKTFETKRFPFVELGMYPGKRTAVPIKRNRNFLRFQTLLKDGWACKTFGLTPSLEIVAFLSKKKTQPPRRNNIFGIDVNYGGFAFTVLSPEGRIVRQGYLGQHIWSRKRYFMERRAVLQSVRALKKLKQLRHRQRDFVETNLGQVVREIVLLAKSYDADVSIETLSKFKPKGRHFNKKAMTIPFRLFRRILEARCFDNGMTLNRVDAYHTSKWCTRCGAVGKGHDGSNYSLFRCRECGQVVNSDRKASLAVAVKAFLERSGFPNQNSFQISGKRVPVSGLIRQSPMTQGRMTVPTLALERGKPTT
jgi:IS605 OrfB family transposase